MQTSPAFWSDHRTANLSSCMATYPYLLRILESRYLTGGASDIKAGLISDPMLLDSISLFVYLGVTCKNSDQNLKI